jgi:alpha-tubulin suppressor-like RCC1 family protein
MTSELFVTIASSGAHTCGIETQGAMYCWGYNGSGQIGNNTVALATSPQVVENSADWSALAVGGDHTCGINVMGVPRCWGLNANGQVGDGTTVDRRVPVALTPVSAMPKGTAIAAGQNHTCMVGEDSSLWCWGDNLQGQLAVNTLFSTNTARPTPLLEGGWRTVAAGGAHTCAIRTDGTLWCWGANHRGQLGDGSLIARRAPVKIEGEGWTSVSCGTDHTCGTRDDGSTWCWGNNTDGQTGTGGAWTWELREIVAPAR